jgi:hypothetical protein
MKTLLIIALSALAISVSAALVPPFVGTNEVPTRLQWNTANVALSNAIAGVGSPTGGVSAATATNIADANSKANIANTNAAIQTQFQNTNTAVQAEFQATNTAVLALFVATNTAVQSEFQATNTAMLALLTNKLGTIASSATNLTSYGFTVVSNLLVGASGDGRIYYNNTADEFIFTNVFRQTSFKLGLVFTTGDIVGGNATLSGGQTNTGPMKASIFYGDGSQLTGVTGGSGINPSAGTGTNITLLNNTTLSNANVSGTITGATVIATTANIVTANVSGGLTGATVTATSGTINGTLSSLGTNVISGAFVRVPTKSGNGTFTVTGSSYGTIATNASFTMTLSGSASNGQYFCLAISNYNSSSITLTSSPALMEPSVGSTNLFTILPGVTIWDLIYKTNFVGSGAWHIRGEPGYVLAAGANVTFTTNGLTITIASSGGSGNLATNANQFGAQVTLTIADSALLTNTVIFGQAKIVSAYVTNVLTASNIISTAWATMVTNNVTGWEFVMGSTVTNALTASNLTSTAWLRAPTNQIAGWSFNAGITATNTVTGSNLTSTAWIISPTNMVSGWGFAAGWTVTNTITASNVTSTAWIVAPTNFVSGWMFAAGANITNTVTGSNFVATAGGTNVFGATQITNATGVPLIVRGPGGSNAAVGGIIYLSTALYTNLGTAPATLTNMGAVTIAGHTLTNAGDSIVAEWDVKMLAAAASTNQYKVIYGSATLLDTGLITGSNGVVRIRTQITRTGNTSQHVYTELRTFTPIAGAMVSTNANVEITETNGINTTLALQGASRIAGASTNNFFSVKYEPATY